MSSNIRVRFAPSPTGNLHLGNIRAALINYLFVRQKKGSYILRIEDTDKKRNEDESAYGILHDLKFLGIQFNEGPTIGGNLGPYLQSERKYLYFKHLKDLQNIGFVYHCFCLPKELEKKRKQQLKESKPPRYDRTCLHLSDSDIEKRLNDGIPFIWRFKVDQEKVVTIKTMERGDLTFDMHNFTDFALTRSDGSFTFLFVNFIDDWLMKITHVIRGEDHLSNTALQAVLFEALSVPLPIFWHLPLIVNSEGKKLSKRDFGFALNDLREAGYLPMSICNYLAIIGGTFENEVQSIDDLIHSFNFNAVHATGPITYDVEKLSWLNHKWINRLSLKTLLNYAKPFLHKVIPESEKCKNKDLQKLIGVIRTDVKTLKEIPENLLFYFKDPQVSVDEILKKVKEGDFKNIQELICDNIESVTVEDLFMSKIKQGAKQKSVGLRDLLGTIRYLLTGSFKGLGISILLDILQDDVIKQRLLKVI